ncbi:MAG: type I-B CRISPR-associated protein Cas7/Cst2/DevR [Thermoproteota archaeon]|nr:MAG: type I-B CRISPR-associated protein Cas7/Cst2/DevR [Candidatus Korarchaeota archaeon]
MRAEVKALSLCWLSETDLTNLNSGEGGSNLVDIKKYRWRGREFPYVSGQAMRFYLKEAIRREVGSEEACVANEQGETCGRIEKCVLCDLFGFMTTLPDRGAIVRVSPVKVSPAMGMIPLDEAMVLDFLTRRHRGQEQVEAGELRGDIVNVELSVNLYKAGLCVDIQRVGREESPVEIDRIEGIKRRRRRDREVAEAKVIQSIQLEDLTDESERDRRVALLLNAVKDFSDYSKQARLLTDFTPDFILIALQSNYSHRLQKALEVNWERTVRLQIERLSQILTEVAEDCIRLAGRPAIFAGMLNDLLENEKEVRKLLESRSIPILTPRAAVEEAKKALEID